MKEEKGITLVSLIIYVIVMVIVLSVMSSVTTKFYSNTESLNASVEEILKFNKFNTYFLKEIKAYDNTIDDVEQSYIVFSSGNTFLFDSNRIYYNNRVICDNVKDISFEANLDKTIITVNLSFEKFSKSIKYKVENIY